MSRGALDIIITLVPPLTSVICTSPYPESIIKNIRMYTFTNLLKHRTDGLHRFKWWVTCGHILCLQMNYPNYWKYRNFVVKCLPISKNIFSIIQSNIIILVLILVLVIVILFSHNNC